MQQTESSIFVVLSFVSHDKMKLFTLAVLLCLQADGLLVEGSCNDEYPEDCPRWADEGSCTNTTWLKWMKKNCPMSCKICDASCRDRIKNQGETDIDCGGPCPACPSCNDGIQNQDEAGVDCGGPCTTCKGSCNDEYPENCPPWADEGSCTDTTLMKWMKKNCPKSCKTCDDESEDGNEEESVEDDGEEGRNIIIL